MDEPSSPPLDVFPLPDDLSACQALLLEQSRTIVEMQQSRTQLSQEVEELKLALARLYQQLYGRRSERVVDDPNQQKLDFGDNPEVQDTLADAAAEAEQFVEGYVRRKKDKKRGTASTRASPPRSLPPAGPITCPTIGSKIGSPAAAGHPVVRHC